MVSVSKKVCLLGDFAVGKTSLVRRFVHNLFEDRYLSTIGVKVSRKVVVVPHGDAMIELTIMLWDLAGTEEFDGVRASYLRGAAGAVLVCDVTRPDTLESLLAYRNDLYMASPGAPLVMAANKSDLAPHPDMAAASIEAAAAQLESALVPTSARTGDGVDELFRQLGRKLVA